MIADLAAAADLAKQLDACTEPDWVLLGLWADAEFGGHEAIQWAIATGRWPAWGGWYAHEHRYQADRCRLPSPWSDQKYNPGIFSLSTHWGENWKTAGYFRLLVEYWHQVEPYAFSQDRDLTNGDVRQP